MNNEYTSNRRTRLKEFSRVRLGVYQMFYMPFLIILLIPILILAVIIWREKNKLILLLDIPNIMIPLIQFVVNFLSVSIPLLLLAGLFVTIGNITAQKDEADLEEAFTSQDLRNGCPILVFKKRIRGTEVTVREFQSSIPLNIWIDRMDAIADSMNISFVEKIDYGRANGRRVVIHTVPGREIKSRGNLYDEDF
ncbi:hypothetical protein ACHAL6_08925 [Proteiniclasticum sp. C24MP]|uniref:hypothetical protein n=1 Tax=Proteiniclasticum sp. C24MP TaxID=3374101 RepID=UPI0037549620